MIQITKQASPQPFEDWKKVNRNEKFDKLNANPHVKSILKNALINEQKGLCCYCCTRIKTDNSHIEHIKPKGNKNYSNLRFSYNNLLASCEGFEINNETCGHNKGEWYDKKLFISPLDNDYESHFTYTFNGKIQGKINNDAKATEAIYRLNLNSYELENARVAIIDSILKDKSLVDCVENIEAEIRHYSMQDANGRLEPFYNIIIFTLNYLLNSIG